MYDLSKRYVIISQSVYDIMVMKLLNQHLMNSFTYLAEFCVPYCLVHNLYQFLFVGSQGGLTVISASYLCDPGSTLNGLGSYVG